MAPQKRKRASIRRHLVLQLRKGWTYESRPRRFVTADRDFFDPRADLPKYTRIRFQVPAMAKKTKRSPAEDELARNIQIVPPGNVPTEQLLERLRSWPCVEKAWIAPTPSPAALTRPA